MKSSIRSITALFAAALILASCGSSEETIVVTEQPAQPGDTLESAGQEADSRFSMMTIGEAEPLPTLDPLHAGDNASRRAVQLIYEGLLRYDSQGDLQPLLAREWEVSDDSMTFRFNLRTDIFYHDSPVFNSGIGRRLQAGDVRFAFERMAWKSVPPHAAHTFMNIEGFEPYYSEQHEVYNPELRQLGGVSGIRVPNDSTVVFRLVEPDPWFLHKLASPYAVIYPPEAITTPYPSRFPAVGTGPYSHSRQEGDSLFIFSRFDNYRTGRAPTLNRVDIRIYEEERTLFRAFATGEVHFIPQPGPEILGTVLEQDGSLSASYTGTYASQRSALPTYYSLYYHHGGPLDMSRARSLLTRVDTRIFGDSFPYDIMQLYATAGVSRDISADSVFTAYTDDLFLRNFISRWSNELSQEGINLQMLPTRAPNRNTAYHTNQWSPLYFADSPPPDQYMLVEFTLPRISLYHGEISGIGLNEYPWWLNVRWVRMPEEGSGGEQP